jgi:uncharacterized protein (DUF427 family)
LDRFDEATAEGDVMTGYPRAIAAVDQREPVPRRVRAVLGGRTVVDTTRALYVWERPPYPQFYIPIEDVAADVVVDENHEQKLQRGTERRLGLKVDGIERTAAARVYIDPLLQGARVSAYDELASLDPELERHTGWCRSMNCGGPLTVSVGEGGYRWTTPSISGCSIPARGIRRAGSGAG